MGHQAERAKDVGGAGGKNPAALNVIQYLRLKSLPRRLIKLAERFVMDRVVKAKEAVRGENHAELCVLQMMILLLRLQQFILLHHKQHVFTDVTTMDVT